MKPWLGALVSLLIALAAVAVTYGQTQEKVTNLEERQKEDRREARSEQREIKADVKEVKSEVQAIRILLESMKRSGR